MRETRANTSFEVLMLRRNAVGRFGGMWVFPGGRVDPEDGSGDSAFSAAAIRELREEAGLELATSSLVPFSFWSPRGRGKRFDTMFFLARAPDGAVQIDGMEVEECVWSTPSQLLDAHAAGTLSLVPPTWRTLVWLASHSSADGAFASAERDGILTYTGLIATDPDGGRVVLWQGDASYGSEDLGAAGARHRLYMGELPWRLELSDGSETSA